MFYTTLCGVFANILTMSLLPESPKWLTSKQEYGKANEVY
jgi:hypothetical protein